MKAHHILASLGMAALLLVAALVAGRIEDESQRVEFSTWVPLALLVTGFLVWHFVFRDPRRSLASLRRAIPPSPRTRVLQLGVVLQVVLAFAGLIILPFVGLTIWNDYVDFQAYSLKPGFLLLLVPAAAATFCLTRVSGSKK